MVLAPGFAHAEFHERAGIENTRGMPEFLWQSTDEVVGAALSVYDRGRAVCVPGAINTVAAAFSGTMPAGVGSQGRRASHPARLLTCDRAGRRVLPAPGGSWCQRALADLMPHRYPDTCHHSEW